MEAGYQYLLNRLKDTDNRPLLAGENLEERLLRLLKEREKFYKCADIYIKTNNKTVNDLTDEIIKAIERIKI